MITDVMLSARNAMVMLSKHFIFVRVRFCGHVAGVLGGVERLTKPIFSVFWVFDKCLVILNNRNLLK